MVGTDQGYVHRQRQGTGLATVLKGPDKPVDEYNEFMKLKWAAKAKADEQRAKDTEAALAELKKLNPEFWWQHNAEMQSATRSVVDEGATLLQRGINPFTAATPESQEFQKRWLQAQQFGKMSMQIKEASDQVQRDLETKGPDYYDQGSIIAFQKWQTAPLSQHVTNPTPAPILVPKRPLQDLNEYWGKYMGNVASSANTNDLTPQQRYDLVKSALQDPQGGADLIRSHTAAIAIMNPAEQKALHDRATANGRSDIEQSAYEYAERWERQRKPLDIYGDFDSRFKNYTPNVVGGSNEKGSYSQPDWNRTIPRLRQDIRDWLRSDDRILPTLAQNEVPRPQGMNDADYLDKCVDYFLPAAKAKVLQQRRYDKNTSGDAAREMQETYDLWLQHVKSGDPALAQNAAGHLVGTKVYGNLSITSAEVSSQGWAPTTWPDVAPGTKPAPVPGGTQYLRITMKTPMGVKPEKSEVFDSMGITQEDELNGKARIIQSQGEDILVLDLSKWAPNEGQLRKLYMDSDRKYEAPKFLNQVPASLRAGGQTQQQPAPQTPVFTY